MLWMSLLLLPQLYCCMTFCQYELELKLLFPWLFEMTLFNTITRVPFNSGTHCKGFGEMCEYASELEMQIFSGYGQCMPEAPGGKSDSVVGGHNGRRGQRELKTFD